jgi:hypothetical protein
MLGGGKRAMPELISCTCSDVHTRAICDEIGERLRILLDRSQTPTPPKLLVLLLKLQLEELKTPSFSPEIRSRNSTAA